jgi:hypothetical protein
MPIATPPCPASPASSSVTVTLGAPIVREGGPIAALAQAQAAICAAPS